MKIALCTTTIHVPHALKLMRKCSADVRFFVATDKNTPPEVDQFLADMGDGLSWFAHGTQDWKCSESIGWNTLARRNIAFLEALKWGADVIYSWDTDNFPVVGAQHFNIIEELLDGNPKHGIRITGLNGWFDPGTLLIPSTRHRGFPYVTPRTALSRRADPATDIKVGVAAGLIIGNPDVDASTRIELRPDIAQLHLLGQTGVAVDPHTWCVFNTQNVAMVRELVPAWFLMPQVGRMDDIYASLVVQRVARERGYHVHFGPPVCFQERHEHDLIKDLRAEIDGMENVKKLAELLDHIVLPGKSVIEDTRAIYQTISHSDLIPLASADAAFDWLEDCEGLGP